MPSGQPRAVNGDEALSAERTALSNERTLLAYTRTALAFGVAGATLLQFFEHGPLVEVTGIACIVAAAGLGAFGLVRFVTVRRGIRTARGRAFLDDEDEED